MVRFQFIAGALDCGETALECEGEPWADEEKG